LICFSEPLFFGKQQATQSHQLHFRLSGEAEMKVAKTASF